MDLIQNQNLNIIKHNNGDEHDDGNDSLCGYPERMNLRTINLRTYKPSNETPSNGETFERENLRTGKVPPGLR